MFFQNSVGIDFRDNTVFIAWLRGTLKGVECKAFETYTHDDDNSSDILAGVDVFLSEFIEKHSIRGFSLFLGIPEAYCLERIIKMPNSVREELDSVLQYEIEKYIPLPVSQIVYGYHVKDEDRSTGLISVELLVVKKEDIKPFLEIKDFIPDGMTGLIPVSYARWVYDTDGNAGSRSDDAGLPENSRAAALAFCGFAKSGTRVNFLPERFRKKPSRLPVFMFWAFLGLFVLAVSTLSVSYLVHNRIQNQQLDTRLEHVIDQVGRVEKIEDQLKILTAKNTEIQRILATRPVTLDMLKELTKILPADTSLQELDFKNNVLRIKGISSNASQLIAPVESSPVFADAGFESKISAAKDNKESFIIKMTYRPEHEK